MGVTAECLCSSFSDNYLLRRPDRDLNQRLKTCFAFPPIILQSFSFKWKIPLWEEINSQFILMYVERCQTKSKLNKPIQICSLRTWLNENSIACGEFIAQNAFLSFICSITLFSVSSFSSDLHCKKCVQGVLNENRRILYFEFFFANKFSMFLFKKYDG